VSLQVGKLHGVLHTALAITIGYWHNASLGVCSSDLAGVADARLATSPAAQQEDNTHAAAPGSLNCPELMPADCIHRFICFVGVVTCSPAAMSLQVRRPRCTCCAVSVVRVYPATLCRGGPTNAVLGCPQTMVQGRGGDTMPLSAGRCPKTDKVACLTQHNEPGQHLTALHPLALMSSACCPPLPATKCCFVALSCSQRSERLRFIESELKQQRLLLASMTVERDNLQEDIWQVKAAKKQSDEVLFSTTP
jgi:hypothetical protein